MDETPGTFSPEPSTQDAGKWIGRVLIAVIVGEGIWGLIVSVTNNLVLPFLARIMGADANSPLYLGKGDFNIPALFISVLELCFAGIVAVILNSWVQRKARETRVRRVNTAPIPSDPTITIPSIAAVVPVPETVSVAPPITAPATPEPAPAPAQFWTPPEPTAPAKVAPAPPPKAPAKPAKAKPPKEIYYNIVGEPINPTEDE